MVSVKNHSKRWSGRTTGGYIPGRTRFRVPRTEYDFKARGASGGDVNLQKLREGLASIDINKVSTASRSGGKVSKKNKFVKVNF